MPRALRSSLSVTSLVSSAAILVSKKSWIRNQCGTSWKRNWHRNLCVKELAPEMKQKFVWEVLLMCPSQFQFGYVMDGDWVVVGPAILCIKKTKLRSPPWETGCGTSWKWNWHRNLCFANFHRLCKIGRGYAILHKIKSRNLSPPKNKRFLFFSKP